MLNPCSPCICAPAHCEQCVFGYSSIESNHKSMKKIIEDHLNGRTSYYPKLAEKYMSIHSDWQERMEGTPETDNRGKEASSDKPSLVDAIKSLENACNAAEETPKQVLSVEYTDGTEKRIVFGKPVRLCMNDIFGTVNVYDENDDCLFHTSKSLVRTVMLLDSTDKVQMKIGKED